MSVRSEIQACSGFQKIMDLVQTLGLCLLTFFLLPHLLFSVSKKKSLSLSQSVLAYQYFWPLIVPPACFTQVTEEHCNLSKGLFV